MYRIAATSNSQARFADETDYGSETDALETARDKSITAPGVSFGVFDVRHGEGAFLVASFLNGERRFTAASETERGDLTHEHRYSSQVLRHSHPDGDKPHAYFGHPEDFPPEVSPDELYNGEPLPAQD